MRLQIGEVAERITCSGMLLMSASSFSGLMRASGSALRNESRAWGYSSTHALAQNTREDISLHMSHAWCRT